MFGFGNGIMVRELLSRMGSKEKLVVYEPSKDIFLHVMNNYDISDILSDKRVYIAVEELNESEFQKALWMYIHWINMSSQIVCTHPRYNEMFPAGKAWFNQILAESNDRAIMNKNAECNGSKALVLNTVKNMRFIRNSNSTEDLKGIFSADIPVIIVSAGPSLEKNIEVLKAAKGKSIIVAVDTAIKYLLAKDIIPDFTVTVDPDKVAWHYQKESSLDIPLIMRSEANYLITKRHRGKKIFFQGHDYFNRLYEDLGKKLSFLASGGSVSTAAFSIFEDLGFKRIVLIGLDLAYSEEGSTHAGGIKVNKNISTEEMVLEGIDGNMVKTKHDWRYYHSWFVDAVKHFKGEEVIDATEGGAKIEGTKIMPLEEVVELYCNEDIDISRVINSIKPTFDEERMEEVKDYLNKSITDLEFIRKKSIESLDICDRLTEEYKKINYETYTSRAKNNELIKNNNVVRELPINEILDTYIVSKISSPMEDIYRVDDDEKENKNKTYIIAREVYKAILESLDDVKDMFEELLQAIDGKEDILA